MKYRISEYLVITCMIMVVVWGLMSEKENFYLGSVLFVVLALVLTRIRNLSFKHSQTKKYGRLSFVQSPTMAFLIIGLAMLLIIAVNQVNIAQDFTSAVVLGSLFCLVFDQKMYYKLVIEENALRYENQKVRIDKIVEISHLHENEITVKSRKKTLRIDLKGFDNKEREEIVSLPTHRAK
jgi:hypothetical protein